MMLAGAGYAQQTPAAQHSGGNESSGSRSHNSESGHNGKAPVKKTGTAAKAAAPALTTRKEKFSYALGMNYRGRTRGQPEKTVGGI